MNADVIVVGSGASGVSAAWPLVAAGVRVTMIDVGHTDAAYAGLIPEAPFEELRRTDAGQHRYFLGDRCEGIPFGGVRVGAQLTPPRGFIARDVARLTPSESGAFGGLESLAMGGLASGWGAAVSPFGEEDLAWCPVPFGEMLPHYAAVAGLMGVCGEAGDDLTPFVGDLPGMLPPSEIDSAGAKILARYEGARAAVRAAGLHLGRARLAVCSREHRGRGPHRGLDMDFWSDAARAVYRPRWTLEELKALPGFTYASGLLATGFRDHPDRVEVTARRIDGGGDETWSAARLVLAAGTLGTARIVLRSMGALGRRVPLVVNPYTYAPCLNLGMIGKRPVDRRHSLSQVMGFFEPPRTGSGSAEPLQVQIYSYRSLLTFKLMKDAPLAYREGLVAMRALEPVLSIVGLHHADSPHEGKGLTLEATAEGDRLRIEYTPTRAEAAVRDRAERAALRVLRKVGLVAIKRIRPGHGASIHYAGPFPMRASPGALECDRDCRLEGTGRVHLADGAAFARLPAKGLTFTMMANAHRVGSAVAATFATAGRGGAS